MERDFVSTSGKYVEYCIATQGSWKIKDIDKIERYGQIFDALAASSRVKKLILHCALQDGLTDEDLYKFASALEENKSLEELCLQGIFYDTPHGFAAVLQSLENHQPKLTKFEYSSLRLEITAIEWTAFIDFLRSNTKLQELSLGKSSTTEEQIIELMDMLKDLTELTSLDLGNHNNSLKSLIAIAQYVANSKTLLKLKINDEEISEDTATKVVSIMQNNTSLISIAHQGFIDISAMIERNKAEHTKPKVEKFDQPTVRQLWQPVLLPGTTHESSIKQLPSDILRLILWQLSVKPLCAFRRTAKQHYKFMKDGNFWRDYYLKHFSCIPGDVLLLTDLTFGLKLATANTINAAFATSVWEEIVINSFRARNVSAEHYPTNYPVPFMEPVYRQYPQLIGTKESEGTITALSPDSNIFKFKGVPYSYTWFLVFAQYSAVYHLGFEKLNDGQYSGILFMTQDFSEAFSARFDYIEYIFEWFAAKNEEEFAEKCKNLCEIFLSARETANQGFVHAPLYNEIRQRVLEPAIAVRQRLIKAMHEKMESAAKNYCDSHDINASFDAVKQMLQKFMESSSITDSEIERARQQIPKRSSFNTKFLREEDSDYYFNFGFHGWDWSPAEYKPITYAAPRHRKTLKDIPQVALRKLYRVALNFILMPVLKTFWLADMKDKNYELYPFLRWQKEAQQLFKELYYSSSQYVPFSHVSISSAHPSEWPLIALGLANHLISYIIEALDELIDNRGSRSSLSELLKILDQVMPLVPSSVILFLQNLKS